MKYTAEHKGFTLYIEEIQEEGKDVCFEGRCKEIEFSQVEYYEIGFWRLLGAFQSVVDDSLTPRFISSEFYKNGTTSLLFLLEEGEFIKDRKVLVRLSLKDIKNLRDKLNSYLED